MVPAQLDEALVQCMCDDLFIVRARSERAIEDGLQLQSGAHPPQLEVAQEQVTVRETGSFRYRSSTRSELSTTDTSHRHPIGVTSGPRR